MVVVGVGEGTAAAVHTIAGEGGEGKKDPLTMSQTVEKIIETGNKPVQMTLWGFKVASTYNQC